MRNNNATRRAGIFAQDSTPRSEASERTPPEKKPVVAASELKRAKKQVRRLMRQRDKECIAHYFLEKRRQILKRKLNQTQAITQSAIVEDARVEAISIQVLGDME